MAVTTLQSNLVPIKISIDGGTTKKSVSCKKSWSFNLDNTISEEQTDCGVLIGLGVPKWNFDVEGVVNTTPGSTEISAEDFLGLANNQTLFDVFLDYPAGTGTDLYATGKAYLTNLKITNSVGSLMTFTGTISGTGTLDITP
jgi:hypothetical protein